MMAPFVAALVAETAPAPGEAVLDVACGTGFVARAAAVSVGATGRVAGSGSASAGAPVAGLREMARVLRSSPRSTARWRRSRGLRRRR